MDHHGFEQWLVAYGDAWERRDTEAAASLFTPDALYYWTPFGEPKRGRQGIAQAWGEAVVRQEDIHFRSEILAVTGSRGLARWWCTFLRRGTKKQVRVEGIFLVDFHENNLCSEFREWWHSDEGAG